VVRTSQRPVAQMGEVVRVTMPGVDQTVQFRTDVFPWQYRALKRGMDIVLVFAALPVALPLFVLVTLIIKLDSPGPVLFKQERIGRYGKRFYMYKFRSMHRNAESILPELFDSNEASGPIFKIKNDPRITRSGRILRRVSLDELPQIFNVLGGSMSLVGPRPPLPRELLGYKPEHYQRLQAVPGVTGFWQVMRGRTPSFEEMVRMDMIYIENWSLKLDVSIMLRTIPAMLGGRGAY
jgi:lipopolysaccharide/colanic/teichoic acid biosynthesis glycosyltransferase